MNDGSDEEDLTEDLTHDRVEGDRDEQTDGLDGIVLRASSMKWVWVLIGSMAFATLGAALVLGANSGVLAEVIGAIMVLVFGFCAIVAIRQILNPGSLVITSTGLEIIHRGKLTEFAFADCGPFSTWRNPSRGSVSVVFDYKPDGDTETNRLNRHLMGGSRSLYDNYGMSSEALADLLNHVRRDASPR